MFVCMDECMHACNFQQLRRVVTRAGCTCTIQRDGTPFLAAGVVFVCTFCWRPCYLLNGPLRSNNQQ